MGLVRVVGLVAALCFCCVVPVFSSDGGLALSDLSVKPELQDIRLVPEFGTLGPKKLIAMWQFPRGPVRKLLVILKPKNNLPHVFWDYSPSCTKCTGGPEKRKLTIDGLHLNYAVLVLESLVVADDDHEYCDWGSWPQDDPDVVNVELMIIDWKARHGLENLPVVGIGASAGGHILSTLGLRTGLFESIAIIVNKGMRPAFDHATHEYPPLFFVHMPKDPDTARAIDLVVAKLRSIGVPAGQERWYQHALVPNWFSDLIPGVDLAMSTEIVEHIRGEGWLDENGIITSDSFRDNWYQTTARWNLTTENAWGQMLDDAIYEEVMIAYARHQTVSRNDDKIFGWFEGAYNSQHSGIASF